MLRIALLLPLAVLASGCETLQRTPQVDLAPVQPVRYAQPAPSAAPAVTVAPSGSLFQAVSYRPAFEDPRARMPGDTLTVQITERISATQKSSSSVDRSGSASAGVSALPFISPDRQDHIAAAEIRNACRRAGVQVGTIDALLIQLCARHELTLLSTDMDFVHAARHVPLRLWQA